MTTAYDALNAACRQSLYSFAAKAFSIVEPGTKFEWNWHIECICAFLESVHRGGIKRLIINVPPRTLKSFLVARAFPAWTMGKDPSHKFIVTSYGHEVAEQNSMACRRIMKSDWFSDVFPDTQINPEIDRNTHFETTMAGQYYAASALSPVTGLGCFVAGTKVLTNVGAVDIEKLVEYHQNTGGDIRILSYCHQSQSLEYQRIIGFEPKTSKDIVEICTTSGRVVRCTPDHPIYSDGEYRRADSLYQGAEIFCNDSNAVRLMQSGVRYTSGRNKKENTQGVEGCVLQRRLFSFPPFNKKFWSMQALWPTKAALSFLLFRKMQTRSTPEKIAAKPSKKAKAMLNVQKDISPIWQTHGILFKGLRRFCAFKKNEGEAKFKLSWWSRAVQSIVLQNAPACFAKGQYGLCGLPRVKALMRSSHRRPQNEQQARESNYSLLALSHYTPQIVRESVSSVKIISCGEVPVYDITVEGNHNFFANGILVHNCDTLLLDDPIKPMEASSDTIRNSTNDNIRTTFFSRLNDQRDGAIILIMQRVHEDDPTGNLLKDGGWVHLNLPAIAGGDVEIKLGERSWSMKQGDLLFPARLSAEILDNLRRDMSEYHFVGQFLQAPVPVGGGEFKEEWLMEYTQGSVKPKEMNLVILVDPSGGEDLNKKKKKTSDWTVMQVWGLAPDNNYYLLDMVRDRLNPTDRVETLFMLHRKWNELTGKSPKVGYEKYGMMADTHYIKEKQKMDAYHFQLIELGGSMMKEERIRRLIPIMQNGRMYVPSTLTYIDQEGRKFDLIQEMKGEMATFPRAKWDDILDAASRIVEPELNLVFPKTRGTMTTRALRSEQTRPDDWTQW